jgi:hypothetical protein
MRVPAIRCIAARQEDGAVRISRPLAPPFKMLA